MDSVFFDTFTKVRKYGQHPGRMSLVFFMFQSILNIFGFFLLFLVEQINHFHGWGVPPPIRDLIFQPFPNFMEGKKEHKLWFTFLIGIGKY